MMRQREKVVPLCTGRVLEIGVGSGLNFPFFDPDRVERVLAIDPSPELVRRARGAARGLRFPVEFGGDSAETVSAAPGTFDTVLCTFTMCTIPDPEAALRNLARLMNTGARLVFCDHGLAPDGHVRRWQDRLDGIWSKVGGGCHLNRDIPSIIESAGYRVTNLETMYLPGWRPASYNYWGTAEPHT
jgi:SAM-dependent methyltransferase